MSVLVGTCPHGKVIFAGVNTPEIIADFGKDIAEMVAEGYSFQRVEGRVQIGGSCQICDEKRLVAR